VLGYRATDQEIVSLIRCELSNRQVELLPAKHDWSGIHFVNASEDARLEFGDRVHADMAEEGARHFRECVACSYADTLAARGNSVPRELSTRVNVSALKPKAADPKVQVAQFEEAHGVSPGAVIWSVVMQLRSPNKPRRNPGSGLPGARSCAKAGRFAPGVND
jgi:Zn ribbon nucleic-acid-binding protein